MNSHTETPTSRRRVGGPSADPVAAPVPAPMAGRGAPGRWARLVGQSGQATAEYALVMLAAAGLAGMALAWAVGGNGVERLLNAVMDSIIADVTG